MDRHEDDEARRLLDGLFYDDDLTSGGGCLLAVGFAAVHAGFLLALVVGVLSGTWRVTVPWAGCVMLAWWLGALGEYASGRDDR